jgi:hypothetical protein
MFRALSEKLVDKRLNRRELLASYWPCHVLYGLGYMYLGPSESAFLIIIAAMDELDSSHALEVVQGNKTWIIDPERLSHITFDKFSTMSQTNDARYTLVPALLHSTSSSDSLDRPGLTTRTMWNPASAASNNCVQSSRSRSLALLCSNMAISIALYKPVRIDFSTHPSPALV